MAKGSQEAVEVLYQEASLHFAKWEVIKDLIDQLIDIMLNYRQSGHPGGSRSKVHALVATLLSGAMRWDIRHPEKRFADRFILVAGHTSPLVYATLAVLNDALRVKYTQTGDERYLVPEAKERALFPEDLTTFRNNKGLPGHAEMEGKTLFYKFNTGPSGHGSPPAAGEALALKLAGAEGVKVFAFEGDAGLTTGASHETKNSAWGLGLDNLYYVVDWNDFGIDDHRVSSVVYGTPTDWFAPYGWRAFSCERGMEWDSVTRTLLEMVYGPNPDQVPSMAWVKTRKGREYLVYDNKSHGTPHPMNSDLFWETKRPFAEKYGIEFEGFGHPAPSDREAMVAQMAVNIQRVMEVLRRDQELVDYIADRLVQLGDGVPEKIETFKLHPRLNPIEDPTIYDFRNYPEELFVPPGTSAANRRALASFGAWINAHCHETCERPLFIVSSADLADSTNISGFARPWEDFPGFGEYRREENPHGALLPQEITEFANAGISAGLAAVNFADDPFSDFNGFWAACSTYGSFSYLKYGPMRLFCQMAQDSEIKLGKVIWVAGHSGPETADDSRTHFGIFAPGVTQLLPKGQYIDLFPWEHNEVPVVLGAALQEDVNVIVLHLTRPNITIPDREALGMPSHFEAAKGAYIIRDYAPGERRMGCIIVQGTSTTSGIVEILPELERKGLNVKVVAAISHELFSRQPQTYQERVLSPSDWLDSMTITNGAKILMHYWLAHQVAADYSLSSDWDNRWRTGGTVDEVLEEAHISPRWLFSGIERFVEEREERLGRIRAMLEAVEGD
jgi:transketolase